MFKKCSVELADVVAKLLRKSYAVGKVYANWKLAVVTSVPKIANSTSFNDFRPISVTPILSRVAEKIVVNKLVFPATPTNAIRYQFAFRTTGSTTCALVNLLHHVGYNVGN